jgi:hypothetical protein
VAGAHGASYFLFPSAFKSEVLKDFLAVLGNPFHPSLQIKK